MTRIRALNSGDLQQIRDLATESQDDGFRFLARMVGEVETGSLALDDLRQFFLGVFDSDELLAIGGVTPDPYEDRSDLGRVRHVYVKRAARRQGVGQILMQALQARACAQFATLRLRTDTESAAQFYESLGFERTLEPNATHRRARSSMAHTCAG